VAKDKRDTFIERVKGCSFDLDADGNLAKANDLLDMKVTLERSLFELKVRFDAERSRLLISEDIQKKGKNAETREALIELELAGSDHDKIKECKFYLAIIGTVQRHNEIVLDLFFRERGDGR